MAAYKHREDHSQLRLRRRPRRRHGQGSAGASTLGDTLLGPGERQRKKVPLHPPLRMEARRAAGQLGSALDQILKPEPSLPGPCGALWR
eukprot:9342843-Pyramimonas_sp.AAC.1